VAQRILFQPGDILEHGEAGEEAVDAGNEDVSDPQPEPEPMPVAPAPAAGGSLGIGSLRGRDR
jgi:hypothetical protein